jgi:drug/metabolite transporter (DMT)-like permease
MHAPSGRSLYGLALTWVTVLMWGGLPFILKELLRAIDPFTLSWFRLLTAGGVLVCVLALRGGLPSPLGLGRSGGALLTVATLGLATNFALYVLSLRELTPGTTQVLIQLAPVLLLFGSLAVFGEHLTRLQVLGAVLLGVGFACFFNQRLDALFGSFTGYTRGVVFIVFAALTWSVYALAQKQLLSAWSSLAIMAWVDLGCALVLTPLSTPSQLLGLSPLHGLLLFLSCANTLVAYGTFAEALAHWEASKVSATLAATPVVTLALSPLVRALWPGAAPPEDHNALAYAGAALVVAGSALTALAPSLWPRE